MKRIVFWGAKGHARVLHDAAMRLGYELVALFDNDTSVASPFAGVPVHHGAAGFAEWRRRHEGAVCGAVAIGGSHGADRLHIAELFARAGVDPVTLVHPTAFCAPDTMLGSGSQLLAAAALCAGARLGRCCILNTHASVDHECELGDGVHIGPGAVLAGCVRVGACTLIATGAVVLPRVTIGRNVIVGAGAVVTRDLPDHVVAYGNPARVMRKNG
jgi:sugar O-acyltransferase (sialic acid O-acetyltransferase NeuD family)